MLLIAAAILALLVSIFQYVTKAKGGLFSKSLFAFLRFLSVFILLVLLINPKITSTKISVTKPQLVIATDNSKSIDYIKQTNKVAGVLKALQEDKSLQERFDVLSYNFGATFQDSILDFKEDQTKISEALKQIQQLHRKPNTAITLLTDGNQTYGANYEYYKSKYNQPVYAIAFGDTTAYADMSIAKVNANKYAYLGNEFPVELIVAYKGSKAVKRPLTIKKNGKVVYKKVLSFDEAKKSHFLSTLLKADTPGIANYSIQIGSIEGERYLRNNSTVLSVDVIDQKQDVLLISDIKHPDIGAINRIISANKRNTFKIAAPNKVKQLEDYELVIAYQPTSGFKNILEQIDKQNIPVLLITGKSTDWDFLNRLDWGFNKRITNQAEEIFPELAAGFENFNTDDFKIENIPPLETVFGEVTLKGNYQSLLMKKIAGVSTKQPLLAFWDHKALLQGEGIWRWRFKDYKDNENFDNIDGLFNKTFQFLANKKSKQRLLLDYQRINYTNAPVLIQASYFNKSFEFDDKKKLNASLKNKETGEKFNQPFVLNGNYYELDASNLPQGGYEFTVSVSGTEVRKSGYFSIIDFDIENQFYAPNVKHLQNLTQSNGGDLFFENGIDQLKKYLLNNPNLKPIQKSSTQKIDLIDWKYLLGFLIALLAIEWFLRKYRGLI